MVEGLLRQVFSCCFAGDTDSHQISYVSDPKLEEGTNAHPLSIPTSSYGHMQKPSPGGGEWSARTNEGSQPSTARSLTAEEKQREKERLQEMVKEFAKASVQGQPCQWLEPSNFGGRPYPATFSIDKALQTFVLTPEGASEKTLKISMEKIREVMKDSRDTPFSPQQQNGDQERRFVCLLHEDAEDSQKPAHLGLIMPNPYERERFYTCMKILRWAMDSRRVGK
eukprot:gnl/TRDRNA2_/TRDRNA2_53714_c0_seq1.p1 gnl/TRDRNA2_/TRDRNA2_53714_c0~~gnl/TRDRNA2_/TRDRNA2_53714_c0_seq1.p1  ORF type:complete len:224 (+),score=56.84 gnl/TRDRNA2_/TRDRNA2_53714_c0_seq1:99-770(+)